MVGDGFPGKVIFAGAGQNASAQDIEKSIVKVSIGNLLSKTKHVVATLSADLKGKEEAKNTNALAIGLRLGGYRFDKYRQAEDRFVGPASCVVLGLTQEQNSQVDALVDGVYLARDLVSEPGNILTPTQLAQRSKDLERLGVQVEILNEDQMRELGMGALLGVGQGSEEPSQLVVMQWNGGKDEAPMAFVGKGVCFDTGGISIKPASGMEEMTMDMGGAAAVVGAMHAIAKAKLPANVVGVIGCVENMPDGKAQRPGDVVTTMAGKTVEVLNTDAEGRLVLADALWYTKERFKPSCMIDLATLTGAILVSLAHEYAGLFSNNDELVSQLNEASERSGERVWRLPLAEKYDSMLRSRIADIANIGGRYAGSITAAQFLKRFVGDTAWAHLDIAGTAYVKEAHDQGPKGATGYGARLLFEFARKDG